ncbi:MAG: hypothetical protein LUC99_12460 [Clostridiales bacterium]|nr:hypothetical protein [Clostridiales bacterium]
MKQIMAVYDNDVFYADRLAEFANQKDRTPFTAVAFSSLERLKEFTEKQSVELLLVGDNVAEEELNGIRVGQTVRLGEAPTAEREHSTVYKYQSSEEVLREVMTSYQVCAEPLPGIVPGLKKSAVFGVYSPIGRCGKTGFALVLGQLLAKEGRALYLNFEDYSGFARMMGTGYSQSLSDLIYYYRTEGYNRLRIAGMVYNWGGLDYIAPTACAEDLGEIRGAELARLTAEIAGDGIYESIICDLGHLLRGEQDILELCDVIYTPVKEDAVSAAKMEEWQEELERSGHGRLWERVHILKLPRPAVFRQNEAWVEQLLWSEVGDFTRQLLRGMDKGDGL